MNDIATDEITEYVEQVRLALGSVPEATRAELLDDLPEHLAEVLAEGNGSLVERLGAPSAYAAELLAAAGLSGTVPTRRDQVDELVERLGRWLRRTDAWVGPALGYQRASEFLVLLRPAWWVLRGYLLAMVLAHLIDGNAERVGLMPRVGDSLFVAVVLLAVSVVASIWLGRRGAPTKFWPRYTYWAATAVLIVFALIGFSSADIDTRTPTVVDATYSGGSAYDHIQDVFVYDAQGHLVEDAQLYDQGGNPIQFGSQYCGDTETGNNWTSWRRGYPRCPELNPFQSPPPTDGPQPTASPSPSAPSVAPSGIPSPQPAAPSGSPVPSLSPSR